MRGATIAVFNQSGGIAKTTTTRDLGYCLAQLGKKLLLIDADPQGTLGLFLGLSPSELEGSELFWWNVCTGSENLPQIHATRWGIDVGLSNNSLIELETRLSEAKDQGRFLSVLDSVRQDYDVVLIDCPPKISELTVQILLGVDHLLIPVQTETKAVANFADVTLELGKAQKRRKNLRLHPFQILGIVPTLYDNRLRLHREHLNELESICRELKLPCFGPIRKYVAVAEAANTGCPLPVYDPSCPATADIRHIAASVDSFLNKN